MFSNPEPLLRLKRGKTTETIHNGWICVLDNNQKVVFKKGNIQDPIFLRSVAKPIQALPIIDFNIQIHERALAVICGSHSGSSRHLNILKNLMKEFHLSQSSLQCGVHEPFDESERKKLIKKNLKPNPLHNNCSGKHIGMLCLCKEKGWNLKNYLSPAHPLQKSIFRNISHISGTKAIYTAVDGCSAPTFALPVINIARMFSLLTGELSGKYSFLLQSIRNNPYYFGGNGLLDSEIIKASGGKIISKAGAEGIIVCAYKGYSIVLKVADGSPKARSIIILKLLQNLNWLKNSDVSNSGLNKILRSYFTNHSKKTVCSKDILF